MEDIFDLVEETCDIVSAYVSHNAVRADDLPALIASVHASLVGLAKPAAAEPETKVTPAAVRKSIKPDSLTSFIDGKPYKSLKRHLATHGLSPAGYRAEYGLPPDYPMVAASYSAARSELARKSGLGHMRRKRAGTIAKSAASDAVIATPKRCGRPKKTLHE